MSKTAVKSSARKWKSKEQLLFCPGETPGKPQRRGEYVRQVSSGKIPDLNVCEVKLVGDPFTVCVYEKQLKKVNQSPQETEGEQEMATATKTPTAKELRRQAKALDITGWEEMGLADLRTAVANGSSATAPKRGTRATATSNKKAAAPVVVDEDDADEDDVEEDVEVTPAPARGRAKKATAPAPTKKAPAKASKAAKATKSDDEDDSAVNENGNPYKAGTNLYEICELLIVGGKRSAMVKKLARKITINPRDDREVDVDNELDRRLLITAQNLRRDHGFNVVRDGRGKDATIVAEPPA